VKEAPHLSSFSLLSRASRKPSRSPARASVRTGCMGLSQKVAQGRTGRRFVRRLTVTFFSFPSHSSREPAHSQRFARCLLKRTGSVAPWASPGAKQGPAWETEYHDRLAILLLGYRQMRSNAGVQANRPIPLDMIYRRRKSRATATSLEPPHVTAT
jgi:hypothetical protein